MTAIRAALALLGTASFTYGALALWWRPWLDFGLAVAICAACVIGLELCRAIGKDTRPDWGRGPHRERQRQYRELVWRRRIEEGPHLYLVDLKPWPTDDDERR